jgi:very-short-patch-repair endonuclease
VDFINKNKIMRRKILWYNPALKEKARELRNNSTNTEILLWKFLKGKQLHGFDFHRQKPIDEFIVDFFCPDLMLAIEIDGGTHIGKEKYDAARQQKLEKFGVRFLRFKDEDVFYNCDWVMKEIEKWIVDNESA